MLSCDSTTAPSPSCWTDRCPSRQRPVDVGCCRHCGSQHEAVGACTGEACPWRRSLLRLVASHRPVAISTSPLLHARTPEAVHVLEDASRGRTVTAVPSLAIIYRAAGTCRTSTVDVNTAVLHRFFDDKVAKVRASMADTDQPAFSSVPVDCVLRVFTLVTEADVVALVRSLPDKQCSSDPLLMWLLKNNIEVPAPFLCRLFNWSLEHGIIPSTFKSAYITPLLKKADLDLVDPGS